MGRIRLLMPVFLLACAMAAAAQPDAIPPGESAHGERPADPGEHDRSAAPGESAPAETPPPHAQDLANGEPGAGEPEVAAEEEEPARLYIQGLGWLNNLRMKATLRQLRPARETPPFFDANAVEDGAFLLLNRVQNLGFLEARVTAEMTLADGRQVSVTWTGDDLAPVPRPIQVKVLRYLVEPGRRYYYDDLTFQGLTVMTPAQARAYFIRATGLVRTRSLLRFSHDELKQAVSALEGELRSRGYARAVVTNRPPVIDPASAAVRVVVDVDEGPVHRVRRVDVVVRDDPEGPVVSQRTIEVNRLFSRLTREDIEQDLLVDWYHDGYPDAAATVHPLAETVDPEGQVVVDLRAEIVRGPRVRLGTPRFTGTGAAGAEDALARRVDLDGPWLDRLEVDEARARLARLGGFRFVNVEYEPDPDDPAARNPVFELEAGRRFTVDILAGFRSYELLYGGVDVARRNLFGIGHSAELRLVQSFKSTEGYATYSIPDAFAENVTVFALVDLLRREELSFDREELRASVGVRRAFESGHELGLRYSYEFLRAVDAPVDVPNGTDDDDQPLVSSLILEWNYDRRNSAVVPRRGFQVGSALEFALPQFGGEARYIRPEVHASGHIPLGGGRYLHTGVRYTLVVDPGDDALLPFNKRIFPGGDDSVRGYQRGEASPRNADGELIGAESALVANIEFEQLLTPSWSLVAFVDGVGAAAELEDAPWDDLLWSVGGGIRWNTAIGPVRLEYGHNLNRRDHDPSGTLHFSIGFPF